MMKLAVYGLLISCCILLATADEEQRIPRSLQGRGFGGVGRPTPTPTFPTYPPPRLRRSLRGGFGGAPAPTPTFSSGPSLGGSRRGRSLPDSSFDEGRPPPSPTFPGPLINFPRIRRGIKPPPFNGNPSPTFPKYPSTKW